MTTIQPEPMRFPGLFLPGPILVPEPGPVPDPIDGRRDPHPERVETINMIQPILSSPGAGLWGILSAIGQALIKPNIIDDHTIPRT
jgi:hypothetical protein